ncbi:hypothetical protein JK358_24960 [Nocardia sp. 2]|uniref:Uncharacterized protein n=1 Tax=Nocardia acididurans TaxID=2802282 RepID=A0ABS1MAM1_9NOCA|nr:hypothetical protein [Nocardia acididurans]MBL1077657.1 hypothetical protein [Nocardia acididurans]
MVGNRMRLRAGATALALAAGALTACGDDSDSAPTPTTIPIDAGAGPARNPYLAADKYSVTHIDPANTDSFPDPVPRGTFHIDPAQMPRVPGGPVNVMTLASTSPDHRWVSSTSGPRYVDVSGGGFRQVASLDTPGVQPISTQALDRVVDGQYTDTGQISDAIRQNWNGVDSERIGNGIYSVVDKDNRLYYVNQRAELFVFGLKNKNRPEDGIEILARRDFVPLLTDSPTTLGTPEIIVGVGMTYDGHLVVLGSRSLYVLERSLRGDPERLRVSDNETVSNSMAIDPFGGIYFASDKVMRKVVWKDGELSTDTADGAWAAPYDYGRQPPSVKFGIGTGSTPALMGWGDDELVVLTDGADHMKLVAFWRNEIPDYAQPVEGARSPRIAGQIPVTAGLREPLPEFIQSEQSVTVQGYGAFVVQDVGAASSQDRLVDLLAIGPVSAPAYGVQRFEWDPIAHRWNSVWERGDVMSGSMVPGVSTTTGTVFVNGYYPADGWEVTGMDWHTGETVHRTIFGRTNRGNASYSQCEAFPNGDLLFNSISGPFRVKISEK